MKGNLKIIGSNNKYTPLGMEAHAELIANKLIVNKRHVEDNIAEPVLIESVFTLDINNVIIYDKHVHVDAWFVDEENNGGRSVFKLTWT